MAAILSCVIPRVAVRGMPIVSQATKVSTGALRIRAEIRYTLGVVQQSGLGLVAAISGGKPDERSAPNEYGRIDTGFVRRADRTNGRAGVAGLNDGGPQSMAKLVKAVDAPRDMVLQAVGLAREDKI